MAQQEPRLIGLPLMIGLIAVPALFVWLLLRPGYPRGTRISAFTYAFVPPVLTFSAGWLQFAMTGSHG